MLDGRRLGRESALTAKVIAELDEFLATAQLVAGHNVLGHDLPVLQRVAPNLRILKLPALDTLHLSALAFPANPYHALVKDYRLVRQSASDPVKDAELAMGLLEDEWKALELLAREAPEVARLYRYCFEAPEGTQWRGLVAFFAALGVAPLTGPEAGDVFRSIAKGRACRSAADRLAAGLSARSPSSPWLAFVAAWLRVAGGNSVLPAWVRHQFPEVRPNLDALRERACTDPGCEWCRENNDAPGRLKQYFGFPSFRAEPANGEGGSLQQAIVEAGLRAEPLLAILPTGGGKSLCYQLPALVRHSRRGLLTIVVSPLQALMKDQVDQLKAKTDTFTVTTLNGMLTPPERKEVLERVRLGDTGVLYVSPEQLRSVSFEKAVRQREIGCWVIDEAHCLSKWGHDFRPDYLFTGRFIRELAEKQGVDVPPVGCFTATAKADVQEEILDYFRRELGHELKVLAAPSVERSNLSFEVQPVAQPEKHERIHQLLTQRLTSGAAVVFTATRKGAEETATFLQQQDWSVRAYHAGLEVDVKQAIQEQFIKGELQVICATNAFGMGVDKEDVRLVIHADVPGSLENYLQEAGRAGRDQKAAQCVLLFAPEDLETQFRLAARSRLSKRDVSEILRKIRKEAAKPRRKGRDVVITAGEILRDDQIETGFDYEDRSAQTKVVTAISWLERRGFLLRDQNQTSVFQGKPRVKDLEEARRRIASAKLYAHSAERWLTILETLWNTDPQDGIAAEQLAQKGRNAAEASAQVLRDLHDMVRVGLLDEGLGCTAIVRVSGNESELGARKKLQEIVRLEIAMLDRLQEAWPDANKTEWLDLHVRQLNERLRNEDYQSSPETIRRLVDSLAQDGRGLAGKEGSLDVRFAERGRWRLRLRRGWPQLLETADRRRKAAMIALEAVLAKVSGQQSLRGTVLADFGLAEVEDAIRADLEVGPQLKDPLAAAERALLFLHELKVITLQKGLAVFRPAMTIRVNANAKGRKYANADYEPLKEHYEERNFQIHVMGEYARVGETKIGQAQRFVNDYFSLDRKDFAKRYFADQAEIVARATSRESYEHIVESLRNPAQEAIVTAPEDANMLVLAGPGSGKTRTVVHRVAWLLRVARVPASGILVVCFNRSAARSIRKRLHDLVGREAYGVMVQTYHGLALRLTGRSLAGLGEEDNGAPKFDEIIDEAVALLQGKAEVVGLEDDELRERLLAGYSHILVDEYQDIDGRQYDLLSAIAGRNTGESERRLSIMAVGDDDQNIYEWRNASVEYIRRFEEDYEARRHKLVENYRSTAHIVTASNALIALNGDRMKLGDPIRVDAARKRDPEGGRWGAADPVTRGRVSVMTVADARRQATGLFWEVKRLKTVDPELSWSQVAVLARTHHVLDEARAALEHWDIPISRPLPRDKMPRLPRIRELATLLDALKGRRDEYLSVADTRLLLGSICTARSGNPWMAYATEVLDGLEEEYGKSRQPVPTLVDDLYEALAETQNDQRVGEGVFLGTIHSAKGLEFDHVLLADGGWGKHDDATEAARRLFYVGMTRARHGLCVFSRGDDGGPGPKELQGKSVLLRRPGGELDLPVEVLRRRYAVLGLGDLYLGYAGGQAPGQPIHAALRALQPRDPVELVPKGERIFVQTPEGAVVASLSKAAVKNWKHRLRRVESAHVVALVEHRAEHTEEAFRGRLRCDSWWVPLVEVVYQG